ncbi:hypothetical protein AURDEDRAFT_111281 [Auricularia subglabra TFB-10046 SS5]|nr:hypothetical protein AURDEDRAFT_111281 [Auricularia subglabra TFB-10046 SS5]
MGLAPASLVLLFALLLGAHALDANQVGNLAAGIDIRIPLDAFVCDPWLVYYKVKPTAYGRSLGVNYNNVQLLLTTPDNARTPVITFNLPQGEGVLSWRVNMPWNSQFYVAPHGVIEQGDIVQVKKGGGGEACLNPPTQTTRYEFATYNGPAFKSLTQRNYAITTRFPNSRMTSPEAGLQTHFVPAGILVTPTRAPTSTTPNNPKPSSTLSQAKPTSTTPANTSKPQATSSQPQETPSSQSGSNTVTETITSAPTAPISNSSPTQPASDSGANFVPDPSHSSAGNVGQDPSPDAQAQRSRKSYTAPIVASVVIGTLLIILGILCCFMIRRRRQREHDERLLQPYSNESMMTEATAGGSIAPIIYEPQARSAKGPPTRRYDFPDESDPPTETPTSPTRTSEIPMDLERALAVVAAHVRSAEAVIADPSGSPPRYSRTFASAPFAPSARPAKRGHESVTATSATESSDWSR